MALIYILNMPSYWEFRKIRENIWMNLLLKHLNMSHFPQIIASNQLQRLFSLISKQNFTIKKFWQITPQQHKINQLQIFQKQVFQYQGVLTQHNTHDELQLFVMENQISTSESQHTEFLPLNQNPPVPFFYNGQIDMVKVFLENQNHIIKSFNEIKGIMFNFKQEINEIFQKTNIDKNYPKRTAQISKTLKKKNKTILADFQIGYSKRPSHKRNMSSEYQSGRPGKQQ